MTANRDKDADKKATLKVLQSINKGERYKLNERGISWLDHEDDGGKLDELLAFGATMSKLEEARATVRNHFSHLRIEHGLEVIESNGVYRIAVPK